MASLNLFAEEEHRPFLWRGEKGAVLLVHGFLGSPAEMRGVGRVLHEAGWTVQGILLPGFGPQVETLLQRRQAEWVAAGRQALAALRQEHDRVLVVGFSMGGAVALHLAAAEKVEGVVLLAPFWQLGRWWQRAIWQGVKQPLRWIRPLRRANFADPRLRGVMAQMLSGLDVDDPAVQAALRQMPVPVRLLDEILQLGRGAKRAARRVAVPTLVVQGTEDEAVPREFTRQLLPALAGTICYMEVAAGHDLTSEAGAHWPVLARAILDFGARWA